MAKKFLSAAAAALFVSASLVTVAAPAQAAEAPAATASSSTEATARYDLKPAYTVSALKAPGYAGSVAIHAENVGTDRYFGEFPVVSFKVEVKTASGPKGVDRLITPSWYNGAYVRDLGFNTETSTRTFIVTLSNPVKAGESQLIGSLSFGDGLTSEGRLTNYIEVTQVGRIAGDTSSGNDQRVDSRQATLTDFGNPNKGIF
ncbi:hypothetical protein [Rothia aerolata]|uniref:Uncharacterized protein n=1 Tax=Rothia aerolata TaxID=1812262 RepID=A0A917IXT6_9MICC|nr:hypothetical protein [Rothia aerolata]GGH65037.1 hypothetical protein GCM10007359_17880 [Rothia aerolata]